MGYGSTRFNVQSPTAVFASTTDAVTYLSRDSSDAAKVRYFAESTMVSVARRGAVA
jgi:hypothetical protein